MKKWWKELMDRPLLKAFLHYYQASDSELTSVAVAYYWLISIFPLLMIMVNILPYFQIPVSNFLLTIKEFLPDTVYDVVAKIVREVLTQPSTGLLSFAVLSALWTFSKSMDFLQKAFNKAYGVTKSRGIISHQLMSLLVSFGLQILFCLCLIFEYVWSYVAQPPQNLLAIRQSAIFLPARFYRPSGLCLDLCHSSYDLLLPSKSKSTTNPLCFTRKYLCLANSYLFIEYLFCLRQ